MNRAFERIWRILSKPEATTRLSDDELPPRTLPVIWLLGKTGAGKSSLIRCLTGVESAQLGNGFEPCTRTAEIFDFPQELPLMRFLDTRGLGETHYDPADDIAVCRDRSHVALVVARLDDPVQGEIAGVLGRVHKESPDTRILVVHNGTNLVTDPQARFRARSQTQQLFEEATATTLPCVEVALAPELLDRDSPGVDGLIKLLDETMPEVALLLARRELRDVERQYYSRVRNRIFWYASSAGATDMAPVVGAVTVPSIQAAMLRSLAKSYGIEWTRSMMKEFAMALGIGVAGRFGGSYLARQLGKLIPGYGQTVMAATSGTISFAATFALGRAAAYYLHHVQHGNNIDKDEIRSLYTDALRRARHNRD